MNPLFFSRFKQLSQPANVTRCASSLWMCWCGYALLHVYICVWVCACESSFLHNGMERNQTDSFTRVRVYVCWANAMVCYTFCRTFLRLRYSDYLYESLKSVTLDWNARAYTIITSRKKTKPARKRKEKKSFDKTKNSATKLCLNSVCITVRIHFCSAFFMLLFNFSSRVSHYMQKQLKKQQTRYHLHHKKYESRCNECTANTHQKQKIKFSGY